MSSQETSCGGYIECSNQHGKPTVCTDYNQHKSKMISGDTMYVSHSMRAVNYVFNSACAWNRCRKFT